MEYIKFEEMIMEKYPQLFNVVDGKVMPASCGISCPPGWHNLVDILCSTIVSHTKGKDCIPTKNVWTLFKYALYKKLWIRIHNTIHPFVDPWKHCKGRALTRTQSQVIEATRKYKLHRILSNITRKLMPNRFNFVARPEIKIAQIKEKFGGLRFYYDGGDARVAGMVDLAENLSMKICQETGESGETRVKNGWWATLSERRAKELQYNELV